MDLKTYLKTNRIKLRDFAADIGESETAVRKWVYGQRQPGLSSALAVERHTLGAVTCADMAIQSDAA